MQNKTTNLFFDDQRLYLRSGLTRHYGKPKFIESSIYNHGESSFPSHGFPSIWHDEENNKYHIFYNSIMPNNKVVQLAGISDDGIHFKPRNTAREAGIKDYDFENQMLDYFDGELAFVLVDKRADKSERLKAFVTAYKRDKLIAQDVYYYSADGIHWKLKEGVEWNKRGAEPGAGAFWCEDNESYIITSRPDWGVRRVCVIESKDLINFEETKLAIQCDSIDPPLTEAYGMPTFEYKGWYLGFLWLYQVPEVNQTKYLGGTMDCQLAYSLNGTHWQRSIREPFLGNDAGTIYEKMIFPTSILKKDGKVYIYSAGSNQEHGYFNVKDAGIIVHEIREDGFIYLSTEKGGEGTLFTRQMIWQGGNISINLNVKNATFAIFDVNSRPLVGYSHEDSVPFSGDSLAWNPTFNNGNSINDFKDKVITIEIKIKDGSIYSFSGNYINVMGKEAERYIRDGLMPTTKGFK